MPTTAASPGTARDVHRSPPDGLAAGAATTAPAGSQDGMRAEVPDLLARTLSAITRRRRAHEARTSRADLAHAPVAAGGLDEATRALLRRQADLHAARHAPAG